MEYGTSPRFFTETMIAIAVFVILVIFIVVFINAYLPFKERRDYIKMEIGRSDSEREYRYWKKELKRLYIKSIPLIGRFFK